MAATKYQVLYRYINEGTNTPITNSMENAYNEVCEFYTDPNHKIFSQDPMEQAEAIDEQHEMISFGNSADNPKTNMLFAYNGTKKIRHKKWVSEATGYVVRDWTQLRRSDIGNQGDFTKDFTTINANTPEDGGTVICSERVMKKYFPSTLTVVDSGSFSSTQMQSMITDATFFSLNTSSWEEHMQPSKSAITYGYYTNVEKRYYTGPILMNGMTLGIITLYDRYEKKSSGTAEGNWSETNLYSKATITQAQLETVSFPGHYEDASEAPYLIKDTYKRIQLSPWFVNGTYSSLEAALERAKLLVDIIGIDNVKLIKIVPFDQFIKIK